MPGRIDIALSFLDHGRGLELPKQQSAGAAGVDLLAALGTSETVTIPSGQRAIVPCGFTMALPEGFEAQVRPRSGLAAKHGVTVLNAPGTIDSDYRGEIAVILINLGQDIVKIESGERIAQMVIAPVIRATLTSIDNIESHETVRGVGGFGSTGK